MLFRMAKPYNKKTVSRQEAESLFAQCLQERVPWDEILNPRMFRYLTLMHQEKNCAIELSLPSLLCMLASVCGPKCKVAGISQKEIDDESDYYLQPLNLYFMLISTTGGGKTPTFQHFIKEPLKHVFDTCGIKVILNKYTSAGLYTHVPGVPKISYQVSRKSDLPQLKINKSFKKYENQYIEQLKPKKHAHSN